MAATDRGKKEFGKRLRQQRTALDLRQHQLAERMKVDQTTIAKWERGDGVPAARLADLSEALEWDFSALLSLYHGVDAGVGGEVAAEPSMEAVLGHVEALRQFFYETQVIVEELEERVERRDEDREAYVRELERRVAELNALLEERSDPRAPQPAA